MGKTRETLLLCVDLANEQEKKIIEEEKRKKELQEQKVREHNKTVSSIANEI